MKPTVYLPLNAGPCVKAHVTATLVSSDGDVFESTNGVPARDAGLRSR